MARGFIAESLGLNDHSGQSLSVGSHPRLVPRKVLFYFASYLCGVKLFFYSIVTVAEIYQEDVVPSEDLEAAFCNHGNLRGGVDGQVRILLLLPLELVNFFKVVGDTGYVQNR